jgi:hypothetical protein
MVFRRLLHKLKTLKMKHRGTTHEAMNGVEPVPHVERDTPKVPESRQLEASLALCEALRVPDVEAKLLEEVKCRMFHN